MDAPPYGYHSADVDACCTVRRSQTTAGVSMSSRYEPHRNREEEIETGRSLLRGKRNRSGYHETLLTTTSYETPSHIYETVDNASCLHPPESTSMPGLKLQKMTEYYKFVQLNPPQHASPEPCRHNTPNVDTLSRHECLSLTLTGSRYRGSEPVDICRHSPTSFPRLGSKTTCRSILCEYDQKAHKNCYCVTYVISVSLSCHFAPILFSLRIDLHVQKTETASLRTETL